MSGTSKHSSLINQFSDIKLQRLPDELKAIYDIKLEDLLHETTDFPDDSLKDRKALCLTNLTYERTIELGEIFYKSLTTGVSQRTVGSIFQLAYQLRAEGSGYKQRLFPEVDELFTTDDATLSELCDRVSSPLANRARVYVKDPYNKYNLARFYSMIAASTLQMFTRPPENYIRSWNHILSGYNKFYGSDPPVTGITPDVDALAQIREHFSLDQVMRNTLYRFLYNANSSGEISPIQRYLYNMHISHTGMHIVPICFQICEAMSCDPDVFLNVIYAPRFRREIEGLRSAFRMMLSKDLPYKRQLWKYGRIFDHSFLAMLQTKSCVKLCYLLACVLKSEDEASHRGILDIKPLAGVGSEDRARLEAGANVIAGLLKEKSLSSSETTTRG